MIAYNKSRHSRPMLLGFPMDYKGCYAYSTIISRKKGTGKIINTLVVHGKFIVEKYIDLAECLIQLQKDLLWNRILYFECDGFKIPIQTSYFEMSDYSEKILETINNKCKSKIIRNNITAQLNMDIRLKILDKRIQFFSSEFTNLKMDKDPLLEKYVNEI